jgi:capsular exopolysaccharide synthesis family protein
MSENKGAREQPAELRDYVNVVRAHRWSIVALVVAFTVVGLLYAKSRPPQYRSTARVLVLQAAGGAIGQSQAGQVQGKPINLQTEAELVDSSAVAALAKDTLRSPKTVQQLAAQADASYTTDSQILVIGFTASTSTSAQAGAQAFADAFLTYKTAQLNDSLSQMQATLDARMSTLTKQLDAANQTIATHASDSAATRLARTQRDILLQQIAEVEKDVAGVASFTVNPGDVVGLASLPAKPEGSKMTYAVVGLMLGVAIAFGQAFFRDAMDRRLTGIGELESVLGAPVMSVIPRRKGSTKSGKEGIVFLTDPTDPVSEGYRTLRTGLLFALGGETGRAVMITSASEGEGKSTTAVNLAVALAQSHIPVALVDADLRRPSLHRFFEVPVAPGLIDLLRGDTDLGSALVDVGVARLRFLPAGAVSAETPELFSPTNLASMIQRLKEIGTMVIVDTPPLIISDPLALAPYMDGVLIVADSSAVTAEGIGPLIERLHMVGGHVIGGVLNKYDTRTSRGYASEYGYGTYAQTQVDPQPRPPARGKRQLRVAEEPDEARSASGFHRAG